MSSVPRWKTFIDNALAHDKSQVIYSLATISSNSPDIPAVPHVRSHVHRGFILPLSASRPLLLTTTDIRTPKALQIAQNNRVEIAWWISSSQQQFRIAGNAYIFPSPNVGHDGPAAGVDSVESTAAKLLGDLQNAYLGLDGFSWELKRREIFDSLKPEMKASWARPVPGSFLPGGHAAGKDWPTQIPKRDELKGDDERTSYETALKNCALVIIDPVEVDYVTMANIPHERTVFKRNIFDNGSDDCQWTETIVVP